MSRLVKIIDVYVATTVVKTILLVLLVLAGLELFVEFSSQITDIGRGHYGLTQAFLFVMMIMPTFVYQFFPIAIFLGSLLGLGLLVSHSELVIIRTSGVSLFSLVIILVKAAIMLLAVMLIIGEVVAPVAKDRAEIYKINLMGAENEYYTQEGVWLHDNANFIHVEKVISDADLRNITRYEFDDNHQLTAIEFAESANFKNNTWVFYNIAESQFTPGRVIFSHQISEPWEIKFKPQLQALADFNADQRTLPQLYSHIKYLQEIGLQTDQYEFSFWQRIFVPFSALAMVLLSIPFVCGPVKIATVGLRIMVGALIGIGFHTLCQFGEPVTIVYQVSPLLVACFPVVIISLFAFILLWKTN